MFLSLLILALAPGLAIALYIYLKDRHEREPLGLLIASFFYGVLSTIITLVISLPLNVIIELKDDDVVQQFANAFFRVALVEEFSKFIFLRFILYYNKNFNEPFDGIVYAVMIGMGFATLENILYVFQFGMATGFLRMVTAVPAHASFAILMGYFIGKAKFSSQARLFNVFIGLFVATLFHGLYDYFWFISFLPGLWIGAIASLLTGLYFSIKAIRLHDQISPFRQS
jgi:RsiW-degrading membrane proteinase PrsW (M82 family)